MFRRRYTLKNWLSGWIQALESPFRSIGGHWFYFHSHRVDARETSVRWSFGDVMQWVPWSRRLTQWVLLLLCLFNIWCPHSLSIGQVCYRCFVCIKHFATMQLHLNTWTSLHAFMISCMPLNLTTTPQMFLRLYSTQPRDSIGWLSLIISRVPHYWASFTSFY